MGMLLIEWLLRKCTWMPFGSKAGGEIERLMLDSPYLIICLTEIYSS